jgi:DNA/RNA-binding domain of Phe-tRNA-synthetase-like protein
VGYVEEAKVTESGVELSEFGERLSAEAKEKYTLESLKDVSVFRAYRDFFWKVGIDPTKVRPAAEALIRRILSGKAIPRISNLVDAYNLASIKTGIALAAFSRDELKGELVMRSAQKGERFLGIGMRDEAVLTGKEVVISDSEKLVAVYPHRDSEKSKITKFSTNILILACGVPGIETRTLIDARVIALDYVVRFCGGKSSLS